MDATNFNNNMTKLESWLSILGIEITIGDLTIICVLEYFLVASGNI